MRFARSADMDRRYKRAALNKSTGTGGRAGRAGKGNAAHKRYGELAAADGRTSEPLLDDGKVRSAVRFNNRRFRRRPERWASVESALGMSTGDATPDQASVQRVATFQKTHGVTVDGKVGRRTTRALVAAKPGDFLPPQNKETGEGGDSQAKTEGTDSDDEVLTTEPEAKTSEPEKDGSSTAQVSESSDDAAGEVSAVAPTVAPADLRDAARGAAIAAVAVREDVDIRRTELVARKKRDPVLPIHNEDGTLTQKGIAAAARSMRRGAQPWNPTWLVLAQEALGAPANGAFSVAFVRKIAELQKNSLEIDRPSGILDAATIAELGRRSELLASTDVFFRATGQEPEQDGAGESKAPKRPKGTILEAAVVKVGAATDWADWLDQIQAGTFLGIEVTAHYELLNRLKAAEAYLELKYPNTAPPEIGAKVGCKTINSKRRRPTRRGRGMHQWAMAFDIDIRDNPWILGQKIKGNKINNAAAKVIKRAAKFMMKGEGLSGGRNRYTRVTKMKRMGAQLTTDELADRLVASNDALHTYRKLAGNREAIREQYERHPENSAVRKKSLAYWVRRVRRDHRKLISRRGNWDHRDRPKSTNMGFMSFKKELIIALRDVAGLAWGACDLGISNGDMMHWDLRSTPLGGKIREQGKVYKQNGYALKRQLRRMTRASKKAAKNARKKRRK